RELSAEETSLWSRVARTVTPLRPFPKFHHEPTASAPAHRTGHTHAQPAPARAAKQRAERAPMDRRGEKRVRRGKLEIDARLDLHGHNQDQARAALFAFLEARHVEGARLVLVVTGKGARLKSGEAAPGILKQRLPDWLAAPGVRALIAGYAEAHQRHGGGGAYYVFLRAQD
ncbi:MAG: Smr/MutS family protein, partial [Hyphomonadaceae bacterium]